MADTKVKNPVVIVGTKAQVESTAIGENDFAIATDVEFYTKAEVDELLSGGGASLPILSNIWSDHVINDMSWLRADTFSWHSGDVYKSVYEHLNHDWQESQNLEQLKSDTIDGITITYFEAEDGHKICGHDQEANLIALYEKTGVAWYYLLDTSNSGVKQFKLPRTKWGFTGLRDSVGNYIEAGLPNITGQSNVWGSDSESGALKTTITGTAGLGSSIYGIMGTIQLDASESNSIYGNSDTVQPRATQMYLYFYVGNFEQSAIEQTAGITSEQLNQKVDLDLGNLTLEAKSAVVAMGMPDYSAGVYVSNATIKAGFTAPSPGYLVSTAGWATLTINGNSLPNGAFTFSNDSSSLQQIFIPLDSGDVLVGTGAYKTDSSRFFPVKGVQ